MILLAAGNIAGLLRNDAAASTFMRSQKVVVTLCLRRYQTPKYA